MRNRAVAAKKHACLAVSKGRGERDGTGRKKGKKRGDLRREGRERDDRSVTKRP